MRNSAFRVGRIALVLLFTSASLCADSNKLTISPGNPKQLSRSSLQFTASVNGEPVDGPVKWSSSNTAVATISGTTGIARATLLSAGTTTITAVHGGQKTSTLLT